MNRMVNILPLFHPAASSRNFSLKPAFLCRFRFFFIDVRPRKYLGAAVSVISHKIYIEISRELVIYKQKSKGKVERFNAI